MGLEFFPENLLKMGHEFFFMGHEFFFQKAVGTLIIVLTNNCKIMLLTIDHLLKQAQRRAAGDRSGSKYSEKYVFMSKNMTLGSLGSLLPF